MVHCLYPALELLQYTRCSTSKTTPFSVVIDMTPTLLLTPVSAGRLASYSDSTWAVAASSKGQCMTPEKNSDMIILHNYQKQTAGCIFYVYHNLTILFYRSHTRCAFIYCWLIELNPHHLVKSHYQPCYRFPGPACCRFRTDNNPGTCPI